MDTSQPKCRVSLCRQCVSKECLEFLFNEAFFDTLEEATNLIAGEARNVSIGDINSYFEVFRTLSLGKLTTMERVLTSQEKIT